MNRLESDMRVTTDATERATLIAKHEFYKEMLNDRQARVDMIRHQLDILRL